MIVAHKIRLDPDDAQETYFRKAGGVARFAYNWALAESNRQYRAHKAERRGGRVVQTGGSRQARPAPGAEQSRTKCRYQSGKGSARIVDPPTTGM